MVRALGVVEHQPIGEFLVEEGEIGEEPVFVVVDEGFLEGAIEAFGMGIHFRDLRSEAGSKPVPVPEEQGVNRRGISGESHPEDARRTSCRETPEYRIHPMRQNLRTASFTGEMSRFPIL